MDLPHSRGIVLDAHHPLPDILADDVSAQPDLDAGVRQGTAPQGALGVPLHVDSGRAELRRPVLPRPIHGALEGREDRQRQGPFPPRLWADLDSADARKGFRAVARLARAPAPALALLREELKPAPGRPLTAKEVFQAIADLDSDSFATRDKARQTLEREGRALRLRLLKALSAKPRLETKRQIETLLQRIPLLARSHTLVRPARAVEVLERIGTADARALLESLAKGNPNARLTTDARAALERLRRKP
jgi:hypothetical protein